MKKKKENINEHGNITASQTNMRQKLQTGEHTLQQNSLSPGKPTQPIRVN